MRTVARLAFTAAILMLLACSVATPEPTPEPTATAPATATSTPVVIVVTATPAPAPALDPYDLILLPTQPERFAAQLVPLHGEDFAFLRRLGVSPDTIIYLFYEAPNGSGQHFLASYSVIGGRWVVTDTVPIEMPTPTPLPAPTPGAGREARVSDVPASFEGAALDDGAARQIFRSRFP